MDVLDSFCIFAPKKLSKNHHLCWYFVKKAKRKYCFTIKRLVLRKGMRKPTVDLISCASVSFLLLIFVLCDHFEFFNFFWFLWKICMKYVRFARFHNHFTFFMFVFKWRKRYQLEYKMTCRCPKRNLSRFCYVSKKNSKKRLMERCFFWPQCFHISFQKFQNIYEKSVSIIISYTHQPSFQSTLTIYHYYG